MAVCLPWGSACAGPPEPHAPGVLAPQSLQPILDPVVAAWEAAHGVRVRIGFDTPDRLIRQANGGTQADVFVSADARWMDALVQDGHVEEGARRTVAYDPLVFASPAGQSPARDPRDLVLHLTGPVAVGDLATPPGELAKQALEETRVWEQLEPSIVELRSPEELRRGLEAGRLDGAVTMQSVMLLTGGGVSTHPFSPDLAFGSVIEVAAMSGAHPSSHELIQSLVLSIAEGPEARAGWTAAGMDAHRRPGTGPTPPGPPQGIPPGSPAHGAPGLPGPPPQRPAR